MFEKGMGEYESLIISTWFTQVNAQEGEEELIPEVEPGVVQIPLVWLVQEEWTGLTDRQRHEENNLKKVKCGHLMFVPTKLTLVSMTWSWKLGSPATLFAKESLVMTDWAVTPNGRGKNVIMSEYLPNYVDYNWDAKLKFDKIWRYDAQNMNIIICSLVMTDWADLYKMLSRGTSQCSFIKLLNSRPINRVTAHQSKWDCNRNCSILNAFQQICCVELCGF